MYADTITDSMRAALDETQRRREVQMEKDPESMSEKELEKLIKELEKQMKKAAADLNFEAAAELRDKLIELKKTLQEIKI